MKYFVLGAFSSAIFVYGIALTYGATGSTNLAQIAAFLSRNIVTLRTACCSRGLALMLVGFAFKVAAVPFHMWTPDVYEGAPTPAVGFMAAIAKVGGFAALLRVLVSAFPALADVRGSRCIWVLAAATLLVGAVVAARAARREADARLLLDQPRRLHPRSGCRRGRHPASSASLYYLFAYSLHGARELRRGRPRRSGRATTRHDLERYRGLARRNPLLAVAFAVLLLAQAGAPFTTGFFAKFYCHRGVRQAHSYALAVIAMALGRDRRLLLPADRVLRCSASGPERRVRVDEPTRRVAGRRLAAVADPRRRRRVAARQLACSRSRLVVLVTLFFGIWPQPLVSFAHDATLLVN